MPLRADIACLMYHEIVDEPGSSGFDRPAARVWDQTPAGFRAHMDRIAAAGQTPRCIRDLDLHRPGRHVLLTFDDGGRSALHAAAELERRGWKGHFFIVTGRIGSPGFLEKGDIRELHRGGHIVGSHSHTHPDIFNELTPAAMLEEWRTSCAVLADLLGEPCTLASVPGGDLSAAVIAAAEREGITDLFTSEPWTTPRIRGCRVFGRFGVRAGTPADTIEALVRFRGWRRALWVRRVKVVARRGAPPLYRLYVRHRTREATGGDRDPALT